MLCFICSDVCVCVSVCVLVCVCVCVCVCVFEQDDVEKKFETKIWKLRRSAQEQIDVCVCGPRHQLSNQPAECTHALT